MKIFKTGIMVGRFQHIHVGHEKLINIALNLCDKVLIFVGSAQESETLRNPYPYSLREELINKIYKEEILNNRIIIKPLNDLTNEKDLTNKWGKNVIKKATEVLGSRPEVIVYGKDKNIRKCFSFEDTDNITEIFVDRKSLDISATKVRELLKNDNKEEWKKHVNSNIYRYYDILKQGI